MAGSAHSSLFPLYGCGRLAGNIVDYPADSVNLIDYAVGDTSEQLIGKMSPVSGHEVNSLNGAECNDILVLSSVALDTYRLYRKEYGKCLADLVIPACLAELLEEDGVCPAEQIAVLLLNLSEYSYSKTGAGERMPEDNFRRKSELQSDLPYFILEELSERP